MALFKCDLHIHSIASGHAFNTIDECARYSHDNHYALIGISDHGPNMEGAPHMGYFEMMYRLPRHNQGVSMIYGCEANILSEYGDVDISDDILQKLDYTMAGLHKRTQYVDRGEMNNTAAIVNTIKSGKIDIITHPVSWNFRVNVSKIVEAAQYNKVLLEANKTILVEAIENDRQETVQQYKELLKLSREAGVEIIWGSDTHHVTEMEISSSQLQSLSEAYDFDFESTINQRVDELLQFIQRRKYR